MPIIFQENFAGFTAAGFSPTPSAGQLDSDVWIVTGFSDTPGAVPPFGFTGSSATDFGRGVISGDPAAAGIYATAGGTPGFGSGLLYQPTGGEGDNDGSIIARIQNTTGGDLTNFTVGFDWLFRNTGDRSSALVFEYSTDGATWTVVGGGAFTTPSTASGQAVLADSNTGLTLNGVTVDAEDFLFLRWRHDISAGTGNRDEFGLDNVVVDASGPVGGGSVGIDDVSITEGDAGTRILSFTVTRVGSSDAFSVNYATADDAATAGSDYAAASGSLQFASGEMSKTVSVTIHGDTDLEADESFFVNLSGPTAGVAIADGQGRGTITNDDVAGPTVAPWINEFHYDNAGGDIGEFIEIAGPAGMSLSGFSLVLYNGNGGAAYNTLSLTGVITDQSNGFGVLRFSYPANGIQNGGAPPEPDAIALVGPSGVVEFISYEGTMVATSGPALGLTSVDVGVSEAGSASGTSIARIGHGFEGQDFGWILNNDDTPGVVNAGQTFADLTPRVRVADISVTEGDAGTKLLTFTVVRTGSAEAFDVSFATANGTATTAAGDYQAVSGVLNFAVGETSKAVSVTINGDTVAEPNETLFLNLSGATNGAVVVDAQGKGTIVSDDLATLKIYEIQGASHTSEVNGQRVITTGVVTAIDTTGVKGFWIQDPTGDGNDATSDGIFVFTGVDPTVSIGQVVRVEGDVTEFGGGEPNDLTTTELANPTVTVLNGGALSPLPAAVVLGAGGRPAPTRVIDDDQNTTFDPTTDGLDFYETLEGMRVTIPDATAVSASDGASTWLLADHGAGASGLNSRGGLTIAADDFNPERIQIFFDSGVAPASMKPAAVLGDSLGDVTGVVGYFGGNFEVLPISIGSTGAGGPLPRETTLLDGDASHVTVAAYNVENLDPTDPQSKFDRLGQDIVQGLGAPDIVGLEEIQDADGAGSGANLSGQLTADKLIAAIVAAGGPAYVYVEVIPDGPVGGEPGGNIRQGYLYNPSRVDYVEGSARFITDNNPANGDAYAASRKPLVADFQFNGETITLVDVHNSSRLGSEQLFGRHQPATNAGDQRRIDQTSPIKDFVEGRVAADPTAKIVVMGDFNGFQFETTLTQLESGGALTNLTNLLPAAERYSYIFEGNAQQIDHLLASPGLMAGAQFDIVHMNTGQPSSVQATDHDAVVARLLVNSAPSAVADSFSATEDGALVVAADNGVLVNDTDVNGDTLVAVLETGPLHGVLALSADGGFTYTPGANYNGPDSFTYFVRDPTGAVSAVRTVTLDVAAVNDAPVGNPDSGSVVEDETVIVDVLANDTDVDAGDGKALVSVSATAKGASVSIVEGRIVYAADADAFDLLGQGQSTTDTFTYTVRDAAGATSTATVTITINGAPDGATQSGGNGQDTLTGAGLEERLEGGNGADSLVGRGGADTLVGGNGPDVLDGGEGADLLDGGRGPDTFVFSGAFGRDTVVGWSGEDRIQLDQSQFPDFAAVLGHAAQVGSSVVITLDPSHVVTLEDVSLSSLNSSNFLFV